MVGQRQRTRLGQRRPRLGQWRRAALGQWRLPQLGQRRAPLVQLLDPMAGGQPRVELVVIQPTPFCNINCSYCYLPSRDDKSVIAQSTIANLFSKLFAAGWIDGVATVIWHAGGPVGLSGA